MMPPSNFRHTPKFRSIGLFSGNMYSWSTFAEVHGIVAWRAASFRLGFRVKHVLKKG